MRLTGAFTIRFNHEELITIRHFSEVVIGLAQLVARPMGLEFGWAYAPGRFNPDGNPERDGYFIFGLQKDVDASYNALQGKGAA